MPDVRLYDVVARCYAERASVHEPHMSALFIPAVSDTHGHAAGDETLKTLVVLCHDALREGDVSIETALDCADHALYAAKRGGRNRVAQAEVAAE